MLLAYFTENLIIITSILMLIFGLEYAYNRYKEKKLEEAMKKRGFIRVKVGSKVDQSVELEGFVSKYSYRHFSRQYGNYVDYLFIDCYGQESLLDGSKISYMKYKP